MKVKKAMKAMRVSERDIVFENPSGGEVGVSK
jgi:hypothetical protein